jgi:hypothetical protein
LSEQKYRQHGYRDSDRDKNWDQNKERASSADRPVRQETFGPRAIQMPGTQAVSRCAQCGTVLTQLSEPVGQCPKCAFELHSCKQCANFDPSVRFECMQAVPERVPRKDARNDCTFYSISVRVEKQTSTGKAAGPSDARKAFDSLFKD